MLPVAVARSDSVMHFRFCNAENRPDLKTTHVSSSLPGGGTGGDVCRLRLRLVLLLCKM